MDFDSVVDELYGLGLDEFTATRDERVREARAAKDRDLANRIKALRRPSVAAWAINISARADPQPIRTVLDLGTDLRTAQEGGSGDLRALLDSRAAAISAAVEAVRRSAAAHDRPLSESGVGEVEQTLRAAMAEDGVNAAVSAGRLTAAVTSSVLAGLDLSAVAAPPREGSPRSDASVRTTPETDRDQAEPAGEPGAQPEDVPDQLAQAKAARALDQARRAVAAAQRALDSARAGAKRADADVTTAEDRVARLKKDLATAEAHAAEATKIRDDAHEAVRAAEVALKDAEADAAAAEKSTKPT